MDQATPIQERNLRSQALIELAVFGGVLFFIIGGIMMNYISGAFQQDAQLRSMRRALLMSYQASKEGSARRTSASFLAYEDRLSGEFGQFGSLDRQPVVAMGSGMMSAQGMQINDWNDPDVIPFMDLVVNGERFVLRTDAYASYMIVLRNDGEVQIIQHRPVPKSELTQTTPTGFGACDDGSAISCMTDDDCTQGGSCHMQTVTTTLSVEQVIAPDVRNCLAPGGAAGGYVINCHAGTQEQRDRLAREWKAMARADNNMPPFFTTMVANDADFQKFWSDTEANRNISFNLTRKEGGLVFPYQYTLPFWRWSWGYFWEPKDSDTEYLKKQNIKQKLVDKEAPYLSYDIDGDLREEALYNVAVATAVIGGCQAAYRVDVRDAKLADVDFGIDPKSLADPGQRPGMRPEFRIYGQTACVETAGSGCSDDDATYLDVKEGKLYSDGKQVAVSVLKKNQYDIVERSYQLNINMGDVGGFINNNNQDGRKVQNGCGGTNFIDTCFDASTKTLKIRSRLNDRRGRKWITDVDKRTLNQSLGGK